MNPALDLGTSASEVVPSHKIRCGPLQRHPGGGGVNVARVVHRLGGTCLALFPAGGATGQVFRALLAQEGVVSECVEIAGDTRESFSVKELASQKEYRFVLPGPVLAGSEWQACLDRLSGLERPSAFVVASGSLPPGAPVDFYARLSRLLKPQGVKLVLDTSGPALAAALEEGAYLIKPSLRELGELSGRVLRTEPEWREAAEGLIRQGRVQVVVLSLGEGGAWLFTKDRAVFAPALQVPVLSTIGAGDSFVGGMVWALSKGLALEASFRYGVAAASAALLSTGTGLCQAQDVARLLADVTLVTP
jgi:6-phosphofructokinase 2